ncbi:protein-L-isoaspartate O-methyltransferase family protein [Halalkalicoccus jeotgali]|uniref:protein-L-isoaspartate(D-aspartate) O-methyltransferase n=1 Tax=Halalkalicoccus jeotgali (strain DSM 18796 / CECT 7217 / JCM 14584 / KCTC 4019 / B3) TaxID=795797 RepID=D8J915_HALJB|nr:protein-L-isoaspartate O-methyltransferase [Halalkalicoccus jeotgali]ADJ16284.1 protein-L-isoaspartate(D-aspartate) O-methyltransferase [Halalkalicoccus jeotgali B3]ELY37018.1 protein-L-isoaspartate(D-aspartate) O-methyltransferase [Halalkalicoccus jeotgali B3]
MDPAVLREDMVDSLEHEAKAALDTERVALAMREVPREAFVNDERVAYADRATEIDGTTVLAPSTAARLLEALDARASHSILIAGSGVGYTAAVLAEIAGAENVQAIDIDRNMVYAARRNLEQAGYGGVLVDRRDGSRGFPEYAPFDRILVEAAAVRPPRALTDQLAPDGRLAMPMGATEQTLVALDAGGEVRERHGPVAFRPLLLEGQQPGRPERNRTEREDREFAERNARRRHGWEQEWIDWEAGRQR